jgi:tol-pal system protein YbgF
VEKSYRFVLIALVLFLSGCATREDAIILDNRTASLERKISYMSNSNEDQMSNLSQRVEKMEKKLEATVQPMQQIQANSTTQIEALKTQIQDLRGRVEAMEYRVNKEQNRFSETMTHDLKDLQARLQRVEKLTLPSTPPTPAGGTQGTPPPGEGVSKPEKAKEPGTAPKEEQKEVKETPKEKGKPKATPESSFAEAGALLKKQDYDGAQEKYEEYLKSSPKGKNVEEARFGLAECLYGKKDYEEAILSYQKLIKSFPKSKFIPEALYKQALSFINLKDTSSAKLLLGKIIKDYPKSSQANLAKKKLKSL